MDNQVMDKERISHVYSCRNAVSKARQHYIVVEWVALCSLSGGAMKRAVNRNVQLPLKSRPKGGAIFGEGFSGD